MDSTYLSNGNPEISTVWITHLLECAKRVDSCTIPFTDLFGIKAFAICMKNEPKTIRERMNEAGIASVPIKGVTEAVYHAVDIARVFGNL